MPIKSLPVEMQASPVEPDPIKQSSTVSPGLLDTRISRSKMLTGF